MPKKIVWEEIPVETTAFGSRGGNLILKPRKNSTWWISYQDFKRGGRVAILEDIVTGITGDERQGAETALYDGKVWRILWGDHRKAYEKAFPSLEASIEVYEKLKPKYGNTKWSTDGL